MLGMQPLWQNRSRIEAGVTFLEASKRSSFTPPSSRLRLSCHELLFGLGSGLDERGTGVQQCSGRCCRRSSESKSVSGSNA